MDCATVSVDVDESSTELSRSTPKARRPHRCGECREMIEPGERYEKIVSLYDGEFDQHITCLDCVSIRSEFFKEGYYYEMIIEYMNEHVRNCSARISESAISRLTPGGREKVCEMISEYWEDYESEEE